MRPPFLILTPACVLLGVATAVYGGSEIDLFYLFLVMVGAVSAHISVNALNEYDDFKTGLDFATERTPFSGGSGTLPRMPEKAWIALLTGLATLAITAGIGFYFVYVRGFWLLPLGALGLVTVAAYTRWLTKSAFFCLIAPGVGFGPLMVMGADFVLSGSYSLTALAASLVPFFLVSDLLLLNQFPDVDADRKIGRRHLPISVGKTACVAVYGLFLEGAFLTIIVGCIAGVFPWTCLIGLLPAALAAPTLAGVARNAHDIPGLIPFMGKNVVINIATPTLLALGLFFG
ncbi:MAG: prenyltransferase [Desulfobacterales bacterium]|nr:prenyltransferase [Desulfobacterales bacterium]